MTAPEPQSTSMPAGYTARPLDLDDLQQVHHLEEQLFPLDAWPLEMFLAEATHPARRYTVVLAGEEVVAYAGVMVAGDTGDIQTLAVRPEYEGRGIGRALMHRMHQQAQELGATTMMLEVRADNPRAQGLYASMGYQAVHERPRYYRDGTTAVIMQAHLPASAPHPQEPHQPEHQTPTVHQEPHHD